MATRGIIGAYTGKKEWRGRYVHWDNYPHRIVPILKELIARDGFEKVVATIIDKHVSWSTLDTGKRPANDLYDKKNFEPGYGFFHDDGWGDLYTQNDEYFSWAEYAYIMDPDGVSVFRIVGEEPETLELIGQFPWIEEPAGKKAWIDLQMT